MDTKKVIALIIITGILFCLPLTSMASEDVCKNALVECLIDAGIVGIVSLITSTPIGALIAGGSYASWCLAGYDWCKKYYQG